MMWVLIVIASINGVTSVASREFGSGTICNQEATILKKLPHIERAQCFPRVPS